MYKFWNSIPLPVRSAINVGITALLVWLLTDGVELVTNADIPLWLKTLLLVVGVPVLRSINPADLSYGRKAEKPSNDVDLEGDHEVIDWDTL